jgi:molybdopterin synthase sulfur carrier subunit
MTDASTQKHSSILVRIPTPLRRLTGGQGEVTADGRTVQELLDTLERRFPGIKERLYDEAGQLRRFVNIYINDEDIRFAQGVETALKAGDEVSIVPAIAGGEFSWPV